MVLDLSLLRLNIGLDDFNYELINHLSPTPNLNQILFIELLDHLLLKNGVSLTKYLASVIKDKRMYYVPMALFGRIFS